MEDWANGQQLIETSILLNIIQSFNLHLMISRLRVINELPLELQKQDHDSK